MVGCTGIETLCAAASCVVAVGSCTCVRREFLTMSTDNCFSTSCKDRNKATACAQAVMPFETCVHMLKM